MNSPCVYTADSSNNSFAHDVVQEALIDVQHIRIIHPKLGVDLYLIQIRDCSADAIRGMYRCLVPCKQGSLHHCSR